MDIHSRTRPPLKEKKAAAGEGREPGQFQTPAPVSPDAKRITGKATEWAEIEAKVIDSELFDLTQAAMHLPTRKVGLSWTGRLFFA